MFCKDSTSFPGIWYLIDPIDTAPIVPNVLKTAKLISSVFSIKYKKEIILLILFGQVNPFLEKQNFSIIQQSFKFVAAISLFWKTSLVYKEQSKISYF